MPAITIPPSATSYSVVQLQKMGFIVSDIDIDGCRTAQIPRFTKLVRMESTVHVDQFSWCVIDEVDDAILVEVTYSLGGNSLPRMEVRKNTLAA